MSSAKNNTSVWNRSSASSSPIVKLDDDVEDLAAKLASQALKTDDLSCKAQIQADHEEKVRIQQVKRKKDFVSVEQVRGKTVNVVEGLELHSNVFSDAEQAELVEMVYRFQQAGRNGELRPRPYSEPRKWMRGKGRVTIQFGCCYNYAVDRDGNPPGILREEAVDAMPAQLRAVVRRLVRWRVLPRTAVPDSCIINIYDVGDCIPPHVDSHDFLRPFCTLSLVSRCSIVFGSNLDIVGPGVFKGSLSVPLPTGSVLVLQGSGADVAKHAVPAVPTRRISITFRKMDPAKVPRGFVRDTELLATQPFNVAPPPRQIRGAAPPAPSTPLPTTARPSRVQEDHVAARKATPTAALDFSISEFPALSSSSGGRR